MQTLKNYYELTQEDINYIRNDIKNRTDNYRIAPIVYYVNNIVSIHYSPNWIGWMVCDFVYILTERFWLKPDLDIYARYANEIVYSQWWIWRWTNHNLINTMIHYLVPESEQEFFEKVKWRHIVMKNLFS